MSKIKLTPLLIILGSGCFLWKYSGSVTAAEAAPAPRPQSLSPSNDAPPPEIKPIPVDYAFMVQFTAFGAFVTGPMTADECVGLFNSGGRVRCEDTLKEAQRAASAQFPYLYQISLASEKQDGHFWAYEELDKPEPAGLYFVIVELGSSHTSDAWPMEIAVYKKKVTEAQCIIGLDSLRPVGSKAGFKEVVCLALNNVNDLLGDRGCVQQPAGYFLCTDKKGGMPDL